MQKLSIREFEVLCRDLSLSEFIFSSENQVWNRIDHSIKVKLTFIIMTIMFESNIICFRNSSDYLYLDRVKYININERDSILGMIFTVICGDLYNDSCDVSYTIIAR